MRHRSGGARGTPGETWLPRSERSPWRPWWPWREGVKRWPWRPRPPGSPWGGGLRRERTQKSGVHGRTESQAWPAHQGQHCAVRQRHHERRRLLRRAHIALCVSRQRNVSFHDARAQSKQQGRLRVDHAEQQTQDAAAWRRPRRIWNGQSDGDPTAREGRPCLAAAAQGLGAAQRLLDVLRVYVIWGLKPVCLGPFVSWNSN